jgi:hypothetical protein
MIGDLVATEARHLGLGDSGGDNEGDNGRRQRSGRDQECCNSRQGNFLSVVAPLFAIDRGFFMQSYIKYTNQELWSAANVRPLCPR